MTFDTIIDKPFMDFEKEVKNIESLDSNSRLLQMLKDDVKEMMKQYQHKPEVIRQVIENVYGYKEFSSFFNLVKLNDNNWKKECTKIQESYYNMKDAQEDGDLLLLDTCALDGGIYSLYALTVLIIMKRYHENFNIRDFLFCEIAIESNLRLNSLFVSTELRKSRINYILNNIYLPIICVIHGNKHATSALLLPRFEQSTMIWECIHINSNGDQVSYLERESWINAGFDEYKQWMSKQNENEFEQKTSRCISNIQKHFGTCGHWSLFLAFQLLKDYNDNMNLHTVKEFCDFLSQENENSTTLEKFNEHIVEMRFTYEFLIVDINNYLYENDQQSLQFDYMWIESFCNMLLHGKDYEIVQLNVAIMKSLNNLRKLRVRFEKKDPNKNDSRDLDQTSPIRIEKRLIKEQLRKWLQKKKDLDEKMHGLYTFSQKSLDDVNFEESVHFVKVFGAFSMKFQSKKEFLEWLHHWYRKFDKENRNAIRMNARKLKQQQKLSKTPVGEFTDINLQIQKFMKFTTDLLRRQIMKQVSEWTIPRAFYEKADSNNKTIKIESFPITINDLGKQIYEIYSQENLVFQTEQNFISMVSDIVDENKDGFIDVTESVHFRHRFGSYDKIHVVFANMYDQNFQLNPWFPGKLPIQYHDQIDKLLQPNQLFIRYSKNQSIVDAQFVLVMKSKSEVSKHKISKTGDNRFQILGLDIFESLPEMIRKFCDTNENMTIMNVSNFVLNDEGKIIVQNK